MLCRETRRRYAARMGLRSRPRWVKALEQAEANAPVDAAIKSYCVPHRLRIIVVGEHYGNRARLFAALDGVHRKREIVQLIVADRPGATILARAWARERHVWVTTEPRGAAELLGWHAHGMIAFPDSEEPMRLARALRLKVWEPDSALR